MKLFKPHLLLALILAAALSCENNQEQEVPDAKLAASLGSASVSAADNQIEGTVKGVSDWEVSLNNTSWAMVTKGAKQSGNFTVSFDPNNTDNDRKGTVVITSGKQKKTLEFTQKSR
ncbi:MAG: BACON domain-containing protein, partial [Bacteroidales bacterium]|nr:BACON domain-containing protein [Bacteroidales bacterium]